MTPQELELAALKKQHELELNRLASEIELVRKEKELLKERYELIVEQKRIEDKNLSTTLSVATLKMDWLAAAKEMQSLKDTTDVELRDALCIDFANKFRVGFLKDVETDEDSILVLKATAYEIAYRACVATLENRNLRVKLAARDRFTETVKKQKEVKSQKETEKIEKIRNQDPVEKMVQAMVTLGMSREAALAQVELMNAAAKGLVKQ